VSLELSLFQELRLRTPAANLCRVVALFAVGLSLNEIEKMTRIKGETVRRIIVRFVTCSHWGDLRNIIVRKTGISETDLHDLDHRYLELGVTGEDLLHYQGYQCRRRPRGDVSNLTRKARAILKRKIRFFAGNT